MRQICLCSSFLSLSACNCGLSAWQVIAAFVLGMAWHGTDRTDGLDALFFLLIHPIRNHRFACHYMHATYFAVLSLSPPPFFSLILPFLSYVAMPWITYSLTFASSLHPFGSNVFGSTLSLTVHWMTDGLLSP